MDGLMVFFEFFVFRGTCPPLSLVLGGISEFSRRMDYTTIYTSPAPEGEREQTQNYRPLTTHILCPSSSNSLPDSPSNPPHTAVNQITSNKCKQGRIHVHSHRFIQSRSSTAVRFCPPRWRLTFLMRSHKTRSTRHRSIPRSLQRWVALKSSISQLTFFVSVYMYENTHSFTFS